MISDHDFRIASIAALGGIVGISVLNFLAVGRKIRAAGSGATGPADMKRLGFIERFAFLGLALTLLALGVTGLGPMIVWGERLAGWALMAHVAAGGAFLACLLVVAVCWAGDCRFETHDFGWCCWCCAAGSAGALPAGKFDAGQKACFWGALVLGAATALTMMFSMFPIFSPCGLDVLRDAHRLCGLVFVLMGYWHVYQTVIVRRGRVGWLISGRVNSDWARHYHSIWWQAAKGKEGI